MAEGVTIMNSTNHGYSYYELEDMKEICGKCRYSYGGDWSIQDCSYCRLPKALNLMKQQAQDLEELHLIGVRNISIF